MKNLHIEGVRDIYFVPAIDFNAQTGVCTISGESFLEDTIEFYTPVLQWLEEYTKDIKRQLTLNIKLAYFNTNSARCLLDMLKLLKIFEYEGGKVRINWYCYEDDIEMKETVEDFIIDTGIIIELIEIKKE